MAASNVTYKSTLDSASLKRYNEKLSLIENLDPYEIEKNHWKNDPKILPHIEYPDIVNYCVYSKSAYTLDQLKSYKSLDSYNQFISGWVSQLQSFVASDKVIVRANVKHSQSANKPPLKPWVISEKKWNHYSCPL